MHPGINGKKYPNKPAIIMLGSGKTLTHSELDNISNQCAHLFRSLGVVPGDGIAFMLGEVVLGIQLLVGDSNQTKLNI